MKKRTLWKRMLTVAVTFSMVLPMAACGSDKESDVAEDTAETDNSEAQEVDYNPFGAYEETLPVGIGRPMPTGMEGPDGGTYEDNAIKTYIEETLNVEYSYSIEALDNDDYAQQLSLAITGEDLPDVFTVYDINTLYELVENDLIADLTDIYKNYATDDLKQMYDDYDYSVLDRATFDGKLMALPRCSPEIESYVWIRQDWVDKLGLTLDEDENLMISREELEMVAAEFVARDPGNSGNPVGMAIMSTITEEADNSISVVNNSFGVYNRKWLQDEDGAIYNGSTVPEAKEALAWWADMYEKGLLDPQYGTRTWGDIEALYLNGQIGILFGQMSDPAWMFTTVYEADPEARFVAYGLDNGNGQVSTPYYNTVSRWVVVNKKFENPEVAVKIENIIRDLTVNPNLAEEEPLLYEYVAAGTIVDFFDPFNMAIYPADDFVSRYTYARDYLEGNITLEEITNPRILANVEIVERYNEDPSSLSVSEMGNYAWTMEGSRAAVTLNELGLMNYVSPLYLGSTETMNDKQADLNKLEEETYIKIITGELPVDYFDTFVKEWNERGGAAIAEELAEKLQ